MKFSTLYDVCHIHISQQNRFCPCLFQRKCPPDISWAPILKGAKLTIKNVELGAHNDIRVEVDMQSWRNSEG